MIPGEADTAGVDAMSDNILWRRIGRIASQLVASQVALSRAFDQLLPRSFRVDGSKDFKQRIVPSCLRPGLVIFDVGGGARPCVDLETKRRLGLTVTGVDIDEQQFAKAPRGLYDRTIVADITTFWDQNAADIVVCKSTLEHVHCTEAALATMARLLKPGGALLVFVPSRNALYARLNMLLPQRLKLCLLSTFMADRADHLGFPATYDHCTPRDFRRFSASCGLQVEELRPYYISSYFSVVFPVYVLWRAWIVGYRLILREHAAESFALIARKPVSASTPQPSDRSSLGEGWPSRGRDSQIELGYGPEPQWRYRQHT